MHFRQPLRAFKPSVALYVSAGQSWQVEAAGMPTSVEYLPVRQFWQVEATGTGHSHAGGILSGQVSSAVSFRVLVRVRLVRACLAQGALGLMIPVLD